MTEQEQGTVPARHGLFTEFAARLARGLEARVEGAVESGSGERVPMERESVAGHAPAGVLVARMAWSHSGEPRSGCFLWFGELGALIGGTDRPVAELSEEEVRTLDQSLRLNIEEGGEGDFPLEWNELDRATGEDITAVLRESGIGERTEAYRASLRIADRELTFLFFESTPDPSEEAKAAPASQEEAPPPGPAPARPPVDRDAPSGSEHLRHLLALRMPLSIRLGSTRMSLDDVLRLTPGSIVELDEREDEPLDVLANGTVIARGEVVVVDERFGLRILEVGTPQERLDAAR